MKIGELMQNRLTGKTVTLLSKTLDYRSENHNVISGNMANIDTPGYRPRELVFDQTLQRAVEKNAMRLKKTNPKHFSHYSGTLHYGDNNFTLKNQERERTATSDELNIDKEMAKMLQNNLLYEAAARMLSKKFEALKGAIEAGRR